MTPPRVVLYDVDRLIRRAGRPSPTGIDRLDMAYFAHFRRAPDTCVIGVVQARGGLAMCPARMVEALWTLQQQGSAALSATDRRMVRRLKARRRALKARARLWRWRLWASRAARRIDPRLLRGLKTHPGPVTYINASHHGAFDGATLAAVRDLLDAASVFYLHDMIPVDAPHLVQPGAPARHAARVRTIAENADLVLTNSHYSRARFHAYCSAHRLPEPHTEVLHIGIEPRFLTAPPVQQESAPYFVAVGTIEPRKNLILLLRVWQRLIADGGFVPELRLIGHRGWVTEVNRDYDRLLAQTAPYVRALGPTGDDALLRQMAGARALLFPSFVEGWGLPLVEALALGTPVIGAQIDAFAEAGQGLATLLPADDPAPWAAAIRTATAQNHKEAAAARQALERFQPPLWEHHFARLGTLIRELHAESPRR